jgi:hypothetical protein
MTPAQPTPPSPDTPPSLASQLLQGITARHKSRQHPKNLELPQAAIF